MIPILRPFATPVAAFILLTARLDAAPPLPEQAVEVPRAAGLALVANAVRVEVHRPDDSDGNESMFSVGSGVICQGNVLTNNHVAGDDVLRGLVQDSDYGRMKAPPRLRLLRQDGSEVAVRGLGFTKEAFADDTAAIAIQTPPGAGIDAFVRFEDLEPGEPVYTMGNTWDGRFLVRTGHIMQLPERRRSIEDGRVLDFIESVMQDELGGREGLSRNRYERIVITTDISQHGFSGGPVVDRHGRLLGLVIGGSDGDSHWNGLAGDCSFVVPIDAVFRAVGQRSTPGTTAVRSGATPPATTRSAAGQAPPAPGPTRLAPPALPESYPVARARAFQNPALPPGAQAWTLNVTVAELAGIDQVRWGEGPAAEVLPLVIGPASDQPPAPPGGAAIVALWTGAEPPAVVLVAGAGQGSQDRPRSAELSLLKAGRKVWHVLPAE